MNPAKVLKKADMTKLISASFWGKDYLKRF